MIEGKKISALDPIENLQDGSCFPLLSRGATRRITFASLLNNIINRLSDLNQEEINEIKRTISKMEKQLEAVTIDNKEVENLLKEISFTINGQNKTILEYTSTIKEFEQEIRSSSIAESIVQINSLIPNAASTSNELADKNFVNSTVGTNTANYIYSTDIEGEHVPFTSIEELEAYSGTVTNNDYAFVTGTDESGNVFFDRYKAYVNGDTVTWAKEYRLNNSSFTAEQWAAIQSGITAEKVAQYDAGMTPSKIIDLIYPIDSIYVTSSYRTNPQTLFPGTTWEKVDIFNSFMLKPMFAVTSGISSSPYTAGSTGYIIYDYWDSAGTDKDLVYIDNTLVGGKTRARKSDYSDYWITCVVPIGKGSVLSWSGKIQNLKFVPQQSVSMYAWKRTA